MDIKKYIRNFMDYKYLLFELVKKNIKLKYRRSYLGILWTLVEPLLNMFVLTIVFGTLFGRDDRTFPVFILSGRLLFSFFSDRSALSYIFPASSAQTYQSDILPALLPPGFLSAPVLFPALPSADP